MKYCPHCGKALSGNDKKVQKKNPAKKVKRQEKKKREEKQPGDVFTQRLNGMLKGIPGL
jgi:uncharacterized Zn finger protein (UPF0148 family)